MPLVRRRWCCACIDLGARPFHHDESQDAYFSWLFSERGDYDYDPLLHGPLRFYLTASTTCSSATRTSPPGSRRR